MRDILGEPNESGIRNSNSGLFPRGASMKLIYIHIPKTAGTSITKILPEGKANGFWLDHSAMDALDPADVWSSDFLTGHFTRKQLLAWTKKYDLSLDGVKIFSVVRHPLDQLRSNLSFPHELRFRGEPVEEPWMKDMISAGLDTPEAVNSVLIEHPWLLNMQWQYLISGSYPDEALPTFDRIFIFPDVQPAIDYCCAVLGIELPPVTVHENSRMSRTAIRKEVMAKPPLRDQILKNHALDFTLYAEILRRRLFDAGIQPLDGERLLDCWVAPSA